MVKISFLGGCREVGRSAILIESKTGAKCILDYGIRFRGKQRLPQDFDHENLKAIALTHCHVDHSGAIPYLYKEVDIPFFTNSITLRISNILIKDMLNIGNFSYPFGNEELKSMMRNAKFLQNELRQKIDENFFITFYNAGHVPGSVSILVEVDGRRILYSGDINMGETNLVERALPSQFPEIDTLVIESTYATREHPPRNEVEKKFVESIANVIESGGKVLIPAFGVARSQEALLILEKHNYGGKIFIDGLAKKICDVYMHHPEYLKDIQKFKNSLSRAQFISESQGRNDAKNSNAAIIAPSGMLKGGASINFIKSFLNDPFSAIYLVGYQAEGSPGRKLLEEGVFEYREQGLSHKVNGNILVAKCNRDYFNFSSHSDGPLLHKYVENLKFRNGDNNIFCMHGDNKSTTNFAKELIEKGYNSVAPEIDEIYSL